MLKELLNYIDIIILAVLAIFLFFMLRRLLGKNIGYTKEEHLKKQEQGGIMPELKPKVLPKEVVKNTIEYPVGSLAHTLLLIPNLDANFSTEKFLLSAKKAFLLIINAFINDDLSSIEPLVSPKVYEVFAENIASRKSRGEKILFLFKSFLITDITAAKIENNNVYLTVKFVSEQIRETVAEDNTSANIAEAKAKMISESWVFYKNTKENKSIWQLVKIFN